MGLTLIPILNPSLGPRRLLVLGALSLYKAPKFGFASSPLDVLLLFFFFFSGWAVGLGARYGLMVNWSPSVICRFLVRFCSSLLLWPHCKSISWSFSVFD